jgi:hypothetical protein
LTAAIFRHFIEQDAQKWIKLEEDVIQPQASKKSTIIAAVAARYN